MAYTVKFALKVDFKRVIDGVISANLAGKKVYGFMNGVNVTTVPGVLVDSGGLITMQGVPPLTNTTVMAVTCSSSGNLTFRLGDDADHINPNDLRTSEVTVDNSNIYSVALTAANNNQLKNYSSSNLYECIDAAPAPSVSVDDTANSVVGITSDMEYRIDGGDWTDYAVTPITAIMLAGIHYVEVRYKNIYGIPSLSQLLNFTTNPVPAAPNVTADDINNVVIGMTSDMEYRFNGGAWVAQSISDINLVDLRGNNPIDVRVKSIDGNPSGLIKSLTFTKESVAAPNVSADDVNNLIVGMNDTMEYNIDAAGWVDYQTTPLLYIVGNHNVDVRYKETNYNNPSSVKTLQFTANQVPPAPNVSADDSGNVIIGLTSSMEYKIDGGSWIDGSIIPNLVGVHIVQVRLKAVGETPASNITDIYFTFNPPVAPNVTVDDVNNKMVGITADMEYRINNGPWIDGSLVPDLSGDNTVDVRVKAIGEVPAGEIKTLTFVKNVENINNGGNNNMDKTVNGGIDIELTDLTGLEAIQPNDVIVLQFNDSVDISTFNAARIDENTGNSLSISYLVKDENGLLVPSREVAAFKTAAEWEAGATFSNIDFDWRLKQTPANVALEAGYFAWESTDKDNDTLIIAPPVGGWKKGTTVRVELDKDLMDDFGNVLENDKDEVIYARVVSESETFISAPAENTTYLPYVDGTAADLVIPVAGYTKDVNGTGRVVKVVVTATATDGTKLEATIPGSDVVATGTTVEGYEYTFTPNAQNGGDFSVVFALPTVVAEQKYKWVITAKATNFETVESAGVNTKIVYHECFDNRPLVLAATVGGKDAMGGVVKFKANEAGDKSVSFTLQGDYLDNTVILVKNTYTDGVLNAIPAGAITTIVNSPAGIEKTEKVIVADVGQFTIGTDPTKDDAEYVIVIQGTSKAGNVVSFPITVKIDTIGLKVKKARKRPLV